MKLRENSEAEDGFLTRIRNLVRQILFPEEKRESNLAAEELDKLHSIIKSFQESINIYYKEALKDYSDSKSLEETIVNFRGKCLNCIEGLNGEWGYVKFFIIEDVRNTLISNIEDKIKDIGEFVRSDNFK